MLYDLTSSYVEGTHCELARRGHSRDRKKGTLQIVFGLLYTAKGCPVAVEVFEGSTSDPLTVARQVDKLRSRFGLQRVVLVGDRGMLTAARIREDLASVDGLRWITTLRAPTIRKLVAAGTVTPSLFDERDLAEVTSEEFPGERLIVCRNPLLAAERRRKRNELLAATEKELEPIVAATRRPNDPLRGAADIGVRVGKVINRYKVAKHRHHRRVVRVPSRRGRDRRRTLPSRGTGLATGNRRSPDPALRQAMDVTVRRNRYGHAGGPARRAVGVRRNPCRLTNSACGPVRSSPHGALFSAARVHAHRPPSCRSAILGRPNAYPWSSWGAMDESGQGGGSSQPRPRRLARLAAPRGRHPSPAPRWRSPSSVAAGRPGAAQHVTRTVPGSAVNRSLATYGEGTQGLPAMGCSSNPQLGREWDEPRD